MKIVISESQLKTIISEQSQNCKDIVTYNLLNKAKQWWLNRLTNNPAIASQILNTKYGNAQIQKIDKNSFNKILNKTIKDIAFAAKRINSVNKIEYLDYESDEVMFIKPIQPTIVWVNCKKIKPLNNEEVYGFLVHELQHIIHEFIGLDLSTTIDNGQNRKYISNKWDENQIYKLSDPKSSWYQNTIKYVSDLFGFNNQQKNDEDFSKEHAKRLFDEYYQYRSYACDPNEVQSRMAQIRAMLKLNHNQSITIDMLKSPKIYDAFQLNLMCWGGRTDNVSLQDFLNNLNLLAKNNTKKISNIV